MTVFASNSHISAHSFTALTEVGEALIKVIEQMSLLGRQSEWAEFWSLNEQRNQLVEALQPLCQDQESVLSNRDLLARLLEKNVALQEEIESLRQAAQKELLQQRQQRHGARLYAQQGSF